MLVENPVEFAHLKFANLCAHLETTYGEAFDTAHLRRVPPTMLFVLLKQHLLPHRALVEAGQTAALVEAIDEPSIAKLAVLCVDDAKVLRYLKLFCDLVA